MNIKPNNLPIQLSSFIGRAPEMAEVKRLLVRARLVTLTGSGGCGKTRLALQVAAELAKAEPVVAKPVGSEPVEAKPVVAYPDGVWLVDLAPLSDPSAVAQRIAAALDVREQPGEALLATVINRLRDSQPLLVLDNCEHLIEACAATVDALLRGCPRLRILATSRENLRIEGETVYRVPSLQLPDAGQSSRSDELLKSDAMRLFVERAQFVRSDFALSEANALSVMAICRQLEGIPLAIELAAARINVLSAEQLAERLGDRFRLLNAGGRTTLPRHQTLRAAIDWSYALLSEPEQILMQRLSVFAGGWTLEAAEAVTKDDPQRSPAEDLGGGMKDESLPPSSPFVPQQTGFILHPSEVLDLLTRLVEKSLVVMEEKDAGPRYRMLETIRQYASQRLNEGGNATATRVRHIHYFRRCAEEAHTQIIGPTPVLGLDRCIADHDNLRAACEWALAEGEIEAGLKLASALVWFCYTRGFAVEWQSRLRALLAYRTSAAPLAVRARALFASGILAAQDYDDDQLRAALGESIAIGRTLGTEAKPLLALAHAYMQFAERESDIESARAHMAEASILASDSHDAWAIGNVLNGQGLTAMFGGDFQTAQSYFEECITFARASASTLLLSSAETNLGHALSRNGQYAEARVHFGEAATLHRMMGTKTLLAEDLGGLGNMTLIERDFDKARASFEEMLVLGQEAGDKDSIGDALESLGKVARLQKDYAAAAYWHSQNLASLQTRDDPRQLSSGIEAIAQLAVAADAMNEAALLFGVVDALRAPLTLPIGKSERQEHDFAVAILTKKLGLAAYQAASDAGRSMTLAQARDAAAQLLDAISMHSTTVAAASPVSPAGLSEREIEVLRLLMQGLTNQQIADQLVVSRRTVHAHMRSIFSKLDVTTRTAAARVALDNKLV